jgi:ABC-type transporter Mla MlaB component
MSVRITTTVNSHTTRLAIAGRLTEPAITELEKAYSDAKGPLTLDVSELLYVDRAGIAELLRLATHGAQMQGASPFIELLLNSGE